MKKTTLLLAIFAFFVFQAGIGTGLAVSTDMGTPGQDQETLNRFDDEFEDNDPFKEIKPVTLDNNMAQAEENDFRVGGFVKLESEYAFHKKKETLSKLKPVFFIETEYRMDESYKVKASGQAFYDASYDIEAKDKNLESTLDDDPSGLEFKDLYLDGKLSDILSIRLGRQIIAWGNSDYARITDVINPGDLTQPGLIDLEDARMPVTAFRFSSFFDAWSVDAVTIHEHPGSKISGKGAYFDYFARLRNPGISIHDRQTSGFGIEDSGFALKITHDFNGGDISLVAANTFDDQPHLVYKGLNHGIMEFTPEYDRVTTYGLSSTLARGSSLFKAEVAFRQDIELMRNDFLSQILSGIQASEVRTTQSGNQVLALAGIEYTGLSTPWITTPVSVWKKMS